MTTVTSKGKMEKIGSTMVHIKPEQLRPHVTQFLDQVLPEVLPATLRSAGGAPPPAAVVRAVSEKGAAAAVVLLLMYRYLAVQNMGGSVTGMASAELFEFHLRVAESRENPHLITLATLSDEDAERVGGDAYAREVEAKREKVARLMMMVKRVQVTGKITLEAGDHGSTKLAVAASVLLTTGTSTGGANRAADALLSFPTPFRRGHPAVSSPTTTSPTAFHRGLSGALGGGAMPSCSREVAEAVLSFFAGAARNLHERFARYEEVDEATLRHFVEVGMGEAPESSEKEKGGDPSPRQPPPSLLLH